MEEIKTKTADLQNMINELGRMTDEIKAMSTEVQTFFYTTKDVARFLGCSIPVARQVFMRQDFPALKIGKNLKVEKTAFEKWCSKRRCD